MRTIRSLSVVSRTPDYAHDRNQQPRIHVRDVVAMAAYLQAWSQSPDSVSVTLGSLSFVAEVVDDGPPPTTVNLPVGGGHRHG